MKTLHKTGWLKRVLVASCACLTALMLTGCSLAGLGNMIGDIFGGKTGYKQDGLTYKLSADGTYYSLVDCDKGVSTADILAEIEGIPVTTIAKDTFIANRSALTVINIPNSVTTLEKNSISQCYYISVIVIPDSVTYIGENAFYHCRALRSITIGAGVQVIGAYAFHNCWDLKTVNYVGTSAGWNNIQIGEGNHYLTDVARNYI